MQEKHGIFEILRNVRRGRFEPGDQFFRDFRCHNLCAMHNVKIRPPLKALGWNVRLGYKHDGATTIWLFLRTDDKSIRRPSLLCHGISASVIMGNCGQGLNSDIDAHTLSPRYKNTFHLNRFPTY